MDFTITLPGLAGIVLTMGMAVDSNVIIYERIREELARGKSVKLAVAAGFERATLTIIDSNLTTLIAAVILASKLGVGPIKGFGVTLFVGIVTTLFTALVVTRAILEWLAYSVEVKSLSIGFGKHRSAVRLALSRKS
jgi:preprotein translocase subunit SecD